MHDDEVRRFRGQVAALHLRIRREAPTAEGLSRPSLQVLAAVVRKSGITPREVGDELTMTSSNVAAALRGLESAGFVGRRRAPDDGRRVHLRATDAGTRLVADLLDERVTWLGRAVATCLDDDEQRLLARAGQLMERLAGFEVTA